jgi:hypothetical protein
MSLFYTACIADDCSLEHLQKVVTGIMPIITGTSTKNFLSLNCDYFLLHFVDNKKLIKNKVEEYGMQFSHELWFDIHYNTSDWEFGFYRFLGRLLKAINGDFVLEYNGDTCMLMRKNDEVLMDDSKHSGDKDKLFATLGVQYKLAGL